MNKWWGTILGIMLVLVPCFGYGDYEPVEQQVTITGRVKDTVVTFMGYTSPNAFITIQEDGAIVATFSANSSGGFNRSLTARLPGTHSYGIFATDDQSRTTPTYGFVLSLIAQTETTVSNILLPTTIDVNVTSGANVFGAAYPNSQVTIFVQSDPVTETVTASGSGGWNKVFSNLGTGSHSAYARVGWGGFQSINSNTVNFEISCSFGQADLNSDGRVDLTDFSILLYYWGGSHIPGDISCDGTIDLTDFSIMMYYWTG